MSSGIWPAVSGARAQEMIVETVANNLANSDTPGFKKDVQVFKEYLATAERVPASADIIHGPIKDKDLYPTDGRDQAFVINDGTYTDFRPGDLRVTNRPLDLALDGKGFFEVDTPTGVRYTKQGSFKIAKDGTLVTTEGHPVLASNPSGLAAAQPTTTAVQPGQGRPQTQGGVSADSGNQIARHINLRDIGSNITVSDSGEIYAGDKLVGELSVIEFTAPNQLKKVGYSLFRNANPTLNLPVQEPQTIVRQGIIEKSNVNPVLEMTNLIKAQRMFEHGMKAIKTYGELLGKEANDIGKL